MNTITTPNPDQARFIGRDASGKERAMAYFKKSPINTKRDFRVESEIIRMEDSNSGVPINKIKSLIDAAISR